MNDGKDQLPAGLIAAHGLPNWWLDAFTPEERQHMVDRYHPIGAQPGCLAEGNIISPGQPASEFLNGLASWFRAPEDRSIAARIRQKIQELGVSDPIDRPGYYRGRHYTTWVSDAKEMKRLSQDRDLEALLLCLIDAVEAEEVEKGWGVAPWYYQELANLYRKHKQPAQERAVLERYSQQQHASGSKTQILLDRLNKLKEQA